MTITWNHRERIWELKNELGVIVATSEDFGRLAAI